MSEVLARRLNDWELKSSQVSFTHTSSGLCLLLVRGLGFCLHEFFCMVSLWASLGFLTAWCLGSTGDHFRNEPESEWERDRQTERNSRSCIVFFWWSKNSNSFTSNVFYWWKQLQRFSQFQGEKTPASPLIGKGEGIKTWVGWFWKTQFATTNEYKPPINVYWLLHFA